MKRRMFIAYFIGVHLLLALVLWKSGLLSEWRAKLARPSGTEELPKFYQDMRRYHARSAGMVPEGSVFFIGDSMIQSLCVEAVVQPSVNYGIGGDTTVGVLERLDDYDFRRASAVVLCIGHNDLKYRSPEETAANVGKILHRLPPQMPVVMCALPAVDENARDVLKGRNASFARLTEVLRETAAKSPNVVWADQSNLTSSGALRADLHEGDGIHLNSAGNRLLAANLAECMKHLPALAKVR